jgi:uncharacterized protein
MRIMKITISWDKTHLEADLFDTPTARVLLKALPVEAKANTWGEEVYFDFPIDVKLEADAREVVDPGTVCFWVQGASLALPFGPTPVSKGDECRLVTKVNVLGRITGDPRLLKSVKSGTRIRVESAGAAPAAP